MRRISLPHDPAQRRAVILMVVLALLALFAIVGIIFVSYAQNSHRASTVYRDAWQIGFKGSVPSGGAGGGGGGTGTGVGGGTGGVYQPPNIDASELHKYAMGQLIYDTDDGPGGVQSSIRGHSLARTMYGFNNGALNTQPFNGAGRRFHIINGGTFNGANNWHLVNYKYFRGDSLRDPERGGFRNDPTAVPGFFEGGANPPVTYPNLDNLALGMSLSDGSLVMPSLHRPWLWGSAIEDKNNGNWSNALGRYLTLRPRPKDNLEVYPDMRPGFPYPEKGGDVKNKLGYPGDNDSIWIDLGYPIKVAPDGRRFKPLFAFHVEDLDGKLNLNTAGNLHARDYSNPLQTVPSSSSHQGWGKWEMNPRWVLNYADPTTPNEWANLFLGNPNVPLLYGRFGSDGHPAVTMSMAPGGKQPRFFAQVDYNSADEFNSTNPYAFTGKMSLNPLTGFPNFPLGFSNGFDDNMPPPFVGYISERRNHARLFDYFRPAGPPGLIPPWDDRLIPVSDVKRILVNGFTGTDVNSAMLTRLMPKNFDIQNINPALAAQAQRRRLMVTPLSMDVQRPGLAPWLQGRSGNYGTASMDIPPVSPGGVASLTAPGAVFFAAEAALEAVDLDQQLAPYPHQAPSTAGAIGYHSRFDIDYPGHLATELVPMYTTAQADRQRMASEIYLRLLVLTGVSRPVDIDAPTDLELVTLRWLAQLAVNIVDFIDEDEISTPFNFYPVAYSSPVFGGNLATATADFTGPSFTQMTARNERLPKFWVFGTELPSVVLNEVFTQHHLPLDNNQMLTDGTFQMKVWAELYCPFPTQVQNAATQPQDTQEVMLRMPGANGNNAGGYSPYQVVIATSAQMVAREDNVLGTPVEIRNVAEFQTMQITKVDNTPVNTAISPQSYFLIGPNSNNGETRDNTIVNRAPPQTPWFKTADMQYDISYTQTGQVWRINGNNINQENGNVTVLLRRLANPHLPPQPNPAQPYYNPYITVDFLEQVPATNDVTAPSKDGINYYSRGKRQPYSSFANQVGDEDLGNVTKTHNSFGKPNVVATNVARTWLPHLDRQVISPFELMHVSGFRPHLLTHQFIQGTAANQQYKHVVPWFDPSTRLYRLFAFMDTPDRAAGVSQRGRTPGKINLNTITDYEVFLALCDPSPSNNFTEADVRAAWRALIRSRSPGMIIPNKLPTDPPLAPPPVGITAAVLGAFDRPYRDIGTGVTLDGDEFGHIASDGLGGLITVARGLEDTILRNRPGDPDYPTTPPLKLFEASAGTHPYLNQELLTKIANNATTRSNTFAVWLTTGFFEVVDDPTTGRTDLLGEEIGRRDGREIRYRFFSVVDRTQLVVAPWLTSAILPPPGIVPTGQPQWINLRPKQLPTEELNGINGLVTYKSYSGTPTKAPWAITKGSILVINRGGSDEETVVVTDVDVTIPSLPKFQALFRREHGTMSITMPGNPGPQPDWSPSTDPFVVPYSDRLY